MAVQNLDLQPFLVDYKILRMTVQNLDLQPWLGIRSFALCSFTLVALLKRATEANLACCSLLKEQRDKFAPVALYKKSDRSDLILSLFP